MDTYATFLLQSRDHESWISRLPNDIIKEIAEYIPTTFTDIPPAIDLDKNRDGWDKLHQHLKYFNERLSMQLFEHDVCCDQKDRIKYKDETLEEMQERAKKSNEWRKYNHDIDGNRGCAICKQFKEQLFTLKGTRFCLCQNNHIIGVLMFAIEEYYEARKKPMTWNHVDMAYPSWA